VSSHVKKIVAILIFTLAAGTINFAQAQRYDERYEVEIVSADDSETTKKIVENLHNKLPAALVSKNNINHKKRAGKPIYIAVGPAALRLSLAQAKDGVIVSSYTSSLTYQNILENVPPSRRVTVTAVYAEPSPLQQFQLASMLLKKPLKMAVILSNKTAHLEPILQHMASRSKIELKIEYFDGTDSLTKVLNRTADVPAILAMPDGSIYSAENIRNILVTTYRRNQSVIGFSSAFVKAGALASTYSEVEDINVQVNELIADYLVHGNLPEPQFPKYFSTIINESVAHSLNIIVTDNAKTFNRKPVMVQP